MSQKNSRGENLRLEATLRKEPISNKLLTSKGMTLEIARGKPAVIKFSDEQEQINCYVLNPGAVGGSHIHPLIKEERIYPIFGSPLLILEDPDTKERYGTRIEPGFRYIVQKGLAHAIANTSDNVVVFMDTSNMEFVHGKDTRPYPLS